MARPALVLTTISPATDALRGLADGASETGTRFVVVGDVASPAGFELPGSEYYDLGHQSTLELEYARVCPERSYTRKNLGYLIAMRDSPPVIIETDDDSWVYPGFWESANRTPLARSVVNAGWVNVYRYFTKEAIWPRGLPLDVVRRPIPAYRHLPVEVVDCPIQQGLIDEDPDVDAVYRLLFDLPFRFDAGSPIAVGPGSWCPFNSQNTRWWPDVYPLMYLPSTCSFRMTDIWRSFVAQRIAWANDWSVLFHGATMEQRRNPHDLTKDFAQEVPGYLGNDAIARALGAFVPVPGRDHLAANLREAYALLVSGGWLDPSELDLLDAWLADVERIGA